MPDSVTVTALFDLKRSLAGEWLSRFQYPWEALEGIGAFILSLGPTLGEDYREVSPSVWVHRTAVVAPTAYLAGPCIIGPETEVRHGAFVRAPALVGTGCVVGNSVELKNVILFDQVETPHYNYVGDSILGHRAHMGAGSITSNVKSDRGLVEVRLPDGTKLPTLRKKVGAMLGDFVEVGCNTVLNPGTVVGRHTNIYPVSCVRGVIPRESIVKSGGVIVPKDGACAGERGTSAGNGASMPKDGVSANGGASAKGDGPAADGTAGERKA